MSNMISLSKVEREELTQRVSSQSGRADEARRARLILLLDAGQTWALIRDKLDCTDSFYKPVEQALCSGAAGWPV